MYIWLRRCWKCLEYDWTWKGITWHQRSPSHAEIVTSRAFSSNQMTFFWKFSSLKLYYSVLSFYSNLNHSIWISIDKIISKIRKLLKYEKLQLLKFWKVTTRQAWTTRDSKQGWRLVILSKVDDSWSLDDSWQKGRWTTREAPWRLVNLLPSSNKPKTPF